MRGMTNTAAAVAAATVLMAAGAAWAVPAVSNVQMAQRENSRTVDIAYTLADEAAIVTLDIETNGVALTDGKVKSLSGDVCKVVQPGSRSIVWEAGADWPENSVTNAKARVTAWSTNAPPQVMVVDLSGGASMSAYPVRYYTSLAALPYGGLSNDVYRTSCLVLRQLSAGQYNMGPEYGAYVDVTLTKNFYAGVFEVTQKQWYMVMGGTSPAVFDAGLPKTYVSYYDIRENWTAGTSTVGGSPIDPNWPATNSVAEASFMGLLRTKTGMPTFDLPTEAQWEYLCRAGTQTYFNDGLAGSASTQLRELGWYNTNSTNMTHTVGQKAPNAWGLYDTHGNVWEWCLDYPVGTLVAAVDPAGATSGSVRVQRGGGFNGGNTYCRSAWRDSGAPTTRHFAIGFRLVRNLP